MSMPAPPGFLSPAAFPFPNGPYLLPNEPAAPGLPYLIGTTTANTSSTSLTLTLITGSNTGDTIVVLAGTFGGSTVTGCTDTEGNSYSIAVTAGSGNRFGQITAVNPAPLKPGDSITVTWTASGAHAFTVIGLPGVAAGAPGGNLIPDAAATGTAGGTTVLQASIAAASLNRPAEVAVAYAMAGLTGTIGPLNWPPDWTVITSSPFPAAPTTQVSAACKVLTSRTKVAVSLLLAGAPTSAGLLIATYMPETRYAPRNPPDMPPGMQSPGAWQYAPLRAPEGPWSTRYNPGPNKWTETLPAVSAVHPAVTRGTGKVLAATPASHGALARVAARFRTLAASPHAAGMLAKGAGKHLAGTAHPAGKLTRATGKTLAATVHAAATLTRSTGKRLAARVTALARLVAFGPAPSFTFGLPGTEWAVSISTIGMSHLSTQYVLIPVAAKRSGAPYNPTGDTIQFAFMATPTQVPGSGDWVAGSWDTDGSSFIYPYSAKCLVGPSGTTTLGIGTYIIYVKITDNPEIPVIIAGSLQIS